GRPENGRGMHGRDDERRERRGHWRAALRRNTERTPQQRLCRRRSETHERRRLHDGELVLEPGTARLDLALSRLLMDPPFAARLPLEMLDDVRHIHLASIDARVFECAIEQFPRWTDERMTREILVVAGLLAHQHDRCAAPDLRRRPSAWRSSTDRSYGMYVR